VGIVVTILPQPSIIAHEFLLEFHPAPSDS
jgi:hypothetical protein